MTAMPTVDIVILAARNQKTDFFPSGWCVLCWMGKVQPRKWNTMLPAYCFSRGNDERSRSKRMHIYVSLLKQMAPEHLLATFAKLCAEILAAASDGALNIDDVTGRSVLQVKLMSTYNSLHPDVYASK